MEEQNIEKQAVENKKNLMGVKELLSSTFSSYKDNFSVLISISAIPVLLTLIAYEFGSSANVLLGTPFMLIAWLLGALSPLAIIFSYKDGLGVFESYRKAVSWIISYAWVGFLGWIIAFGGFFLLVVPAVIFFVWFAFSFYTLVYEDRKGFNALLASKAYVRGYWWPVFGRFLAMIAVAILLIIPFAILGAPMEGLADASSSTPIIDALVDTLFTPFFILYTIILYKDLRRVKGEVDIEKESKNRGLFISVAVWGIVAPIIIFGSMLASLGRGGGFYGPIGNQVFEGFNFDGPQGVETPNVEDFQAN